MDRIDIEIDDFINCCDYKGYLKGVGKLWTNIEIDDNLFERKI